MAGLVDKGPAGSGYIIGLFAQALFDDDEGEDGDGDDFDDAVGYFGRGGDQLLQEEAADKEDEGQAHQDCFERTIHNLSRP